MLSETDAKAQYDAARKRAMKSKTASSQRTHGSATNAAIKFLQVETFSMDAGGGGALSHINVVERGNGQTNRIGPRYRVTKVAINLRVNVIAGVTGEAMARVSLVYDRAPNRAVCLLGDIVHNYVPYAGFLVVDAMQFPNRAWSERFVFVDAWRFCVSGNAAGLWTGQEVQEIRAVVKIPRSFVTEMSPNGITGEIGDTIRGAWFLLVQGDVATPSAYVQATAALELQFKDLL